MFGLTLFCPYATFSSVSLTVFEMVKQANIVAAAIVVAGEEIFYSLGVQP